MTPEEELLLNACCILGDDGLWLVLHAHVPKNYKRPTIWFRVQRGTYEEWRAMSLLGWVTEYAYVDGLFTTFILTPEGLLVLERVLLQENIRVLSYRDPEYAERLWVDFAEALITREALPIERFIQK